MQTNQKMREAMAQLGPAGPALGFAPAFDDLLRSEVVSQQGCQVLAALAGQGGGATPRDFPDRTGFECFINRVAITDYGNYPEQEPNLAALRDGLEFARCLRDKLRQGLPELPFRVIVSFDGSDCVVRFHQVRPGEQWLAADLEGYRDEAVLVLDTAGDG